MVDFLFFCYIYSMLELNKIYNQDCLEGMKLIDDKSIDLIVTDPPYLFDNGNWKHSAKCGEKSILGNGELFNEDGLMYTKMSTFGEDDIDTFLTLALSKMKIPNMYIFCSETQVPIYGMWAREHNLHFGIMVWEKPLSVINKNRFSTNTEYVVRIYDFGTGLNTIKNNDYYNKVIHSKPLKGTDKMHPTQKPIDAVDRFILLSSNEGDVVLDPFSGSATTAVACIRNNRNFIGFELETEYYKKSLVRIEREIDEKKSGLW